MFDTSRAAAVGWGGDSAPEWQRVALAANRPCCYRGSMEERARRPHGIRSRKVSISVSEEDLRVLSARAKRLHRGNLSAVVHEMVASLRREEAADELLEMLGAERVTPAEMQRLRDEVAAPPTPRRKRGSAA
jgi:hypothetical protein